MRYASFVAAMLAASPAALWAAGPVLDADALARWPSVAEAQISDDGRFAAYKTVVGEQPASFEVVSTDAQWRRSLPVASAADFICEDDGRCRLLVVKDLSGELRVARLGGDSMDALGSVEFYRLPAAGNRHWLAYRLKSAPSQLRIRNLFTGAQHTYDHVIDVQLSDDGRVALLRIGRAEDPQKSQSLRWLDLRSGSLNTIWEGRGAGAIVFDDSAHQLAFMVQAPDEPQGTRSIWHYTAGDAQAALIADEQTTGIDPELRLGEIGGFSHRGRELRVDLVRRTPTRVPLADAVDVDVWSYRDERLQSQQLADIAAGRAERSYAAWLDIEKRSLLRLEQPGDTLGDTAWNASVGAVALVDHRAGNPDRGEYHWNSAARLSVELLYFRDGHRIPISTWDAPDESRPQLSPAGRFVVYFDPGVGNFLCRVVACGIVRNLTAGLQTDWRRFDAQWLPLSNSMLRGVAGWVEDDAAVLIQDSHDLWRVDLEGTTPPVNLTSGYGRRHQIVFSSMTATPPRQRIYRRGERLVLAAFDQATKQSGFFETRLDGSGAPRRLTMGDFAYYRPDEEIGQPIKAKRAARYVVRRESATESPNYFATEDFRSFTRLSNLRPERKYNWLTVKLIDWRLPDGTPAQGLLYTPENFDPTRRYPVIFNYYEVASDNLNVFLPPKSLGQGCEIDIPSYVSRGYLVFRPDIHYAPGKLRESAVHAVVSAAEHLRERPWVDAGKMGLQGCSFGGIATNSIVTSTGMFAAAVSASGVANLVSAYGALWVPNARAGSSGGASLQRMSEIGQERMNGHLWQRPGLYVENSAIFHVDRVSTPILLMHTRDDAICPFGNAIEFFTALRRLGKQAWMLQYNDGNHQLAGASANDFSIRMAQFFDHYLKGAPPPRWMTQGIPAQLKGFDSALDLDGSQTEPGPGLYVPPSMNRPVSFLDAGAESAQE